MLRHAYCKAYFPVDSGTPPLGLSSAFASLTFWVETRSLVF